MKRFLSIGMMLLTLTSTLAVNASAADFSFQTDGTPEYHPSTSYEDIYGSRYSYDGPNIVDYQIPELTYGSFSTTQTGIMEKVILPGLQPVVGGTMDMGGDYGIGGGESSMPNFPGDAGTAAPTIPSVPAYTQASDMIRKDGSIGTLKIPSLNINMKVWEGETNASMRKGLGHYSSTSGWDGNVGICGHNRGAKYSIGAIKDLDAGDTITYTTIYGTRTYGVTSVTIISSKDWSPLQATAENQITLTTCLANHPEKRVCVQATEAK